MKYLLAIGLVGLLLPLVGPPSAARADDYRFALGFQVIHDAIPGIVGDCLVDEHFNLDNGDSLQETTGTRSDGGAGGLLVWRKADNWTAFTDGNQTWVNLCGTPPFPRRLNTERFEGEADASSGEFQVLPNPCAGAPPSLIPPSPVPSPAPSCVAEAPQNPWGFDFCPTGTLISSPPTDFCSVFPCIPAFWNDRGYVVECRDGAFSKSGGIQGSCSQHGGNLHPLYSH